MPTSIAIIDSGVDPLSLRHAQIDQSLRVQYNGSRFQFTRCLTDPIGHGTACADLIARHAPATVMHSLAIAEGDGSFHYDALIEAINWCIEKGVQVVNVSLGTTDPAQREQLEAVCARAASRGTFVVAAEHNDGLVSYPAHCGSTIGVRSGRLTPGDDLVYCPDQPIQCLARGDRQRVRWRDSNDRMAGGSSFAAPRVTAMVAAILSEDPEADLAAVHHLLRDRASHVHEADREAPDRTSTICPTGTRAALYPYTKEMHALVRFRDLLSFEITGVADPPGRRCVGRDAGEVLHLPPVGVTISASLPRALEDADLLVLGYVRKLGAIQRRDVQAEAVSQALDVHADVFGFEEIDCEGHATLHRRASDLGRRLRSPGVGMDDARVWLATPSTDGPVDRPVLGVFGTSSAQGKFTLQLALRRELLKRGYRVGQLGTEHHAELFGLDISFPMGYDSRVELPVEYWPEYLDRRLRHLCAQRQPDVLVVGSQSGTVPYDIHDPRTLTLSTLAFLLGTKPDACILVINAIDEADYVQSTIQTLESLSQTRVIALAVSDKQGRDSGGQGVAANQTGDGHAMVEEVTGQLSRLHGRPVFCIGRSEDVCQMTDQVVGTFTQIESKVAA